MEQSGTRNEVHKLVLEGKCGWEKLGERASSNRRSIKMAKALFLVTAGFLQEC